MPMYGILQFSRREKIGGNGILFKALHDATKYVVHTNVHSFVDRWAKVSADDKHELMEILGVVGNYATESEVLQRKYMIKPCKYPGYKMPLSFNEHALPESLQPAFTVDSETTRDMDDALTVYRTEGGHTLLGIHITDVAHFISIMDEKDQLQLHRWILDRGSSAYFDEHSNPMFPPHLAHNVLSLIPNEKRRVISLWIRYDFNLHPVSTEWRSEYVTSNAKLTYLSFPKSKPTEYELLTRITGTSDSYDMIAWCMVKYNVEFVRAFRNKSVILRTKTSEDCNANYGILDASKIQTHINFDTEYTHATSPIRRVVDVLNQMIYHDLPLPSVNMDRLNSRFRSVSQFHKRHSVLELSHKTRSQPVMVRVISNKDNCVIIEYDRQRYKIPRYDSYYEGEVPTKEGQEFEVWGIIRKGMSTLRLCSLHNVLTTPSPKETDVCATGRLDPVCDVKVTLRAEDVSSCMGGYALDSFQLRCLEVINNDKDLFCTAPTGSGKTTVAMMGIMRAFHSGKRAIFSSPIKALSNEKYADFRVRLNGRVSLLTGDMKVRCASPGGDGAPELLIMTAEILRNKLNTDDDLDLKNVTMLIVDECHYINDIERGPVWEETLLSLPKHISIVSLSATLSAPEEFSKWLSKRRKTVCVQHHERHVPLHLGSFVCERFREMTNTTKIKEGTGVSSEMFVWNQSCGAQESPAKLVRMLIEQNMCPAIVFCMSRKRCVQMAESITQSVMVSARPMRNEDVVEVVYEAQMVDWNNEVLSHKRKFYGLVKRCLNDLRPQLEELPQYKGFIELLYKGVGYHHSGMVPVLRELVEVLFREKMLMAVFATESLGVGIDMPARTVVFTQLDKPTGQQFERRNLLTHEFMQMAGRAGRRGKDTKGFVVYYPYPSGKGGLSYYEYKRMVMGDPPKAESQLQITLDFVIRNYTRGIEFINRSLLGYNIAKELNAISTDYFNATITDDIMRIGLLNDSVHGRNQTMSPYMVLNKKQQKKANNELTELLERNKISLEDALREYNRYNEIKDLMNYTHNQWNYQVKLLEDMQFIRGTALTSVGKVASMMSDEYVLVRSQIVLSDAFRMLAFNDIVSWLGIFAWTSKLNDVRDGYEQTRIDAIIDDTTILMEKIYDVEMTQVHCKVNMLYNWVTTKNVLSVLQYTGIEEFGTFIKSILRVASFIEELRQIYLGMEMFDMYNKFENYEERLFYGIVSNASIYV